MMNVEEVKVICMEHGFENLSAGSIAGNPHKFLDDVYNPMLRSLAALYDLERFKSGDADLLRKMRDAIVCLIDTEKIELGVAPNKSHDKDEMVKFSLRVGQYDSKAQGCIDYFVTGYDIALSILPHYRRVFERVAKENGFVVDLRLPIDLFDANVRVVLDKSEYCLPKVFGRVEGWINAYKNACYVLSDLQSPKGRRIESKEVVIKNKTVCV